MMIYGEPLFFCWIYFQNFQDVKKEKTCFRLGGLCFKYISRIWNRWTEQVPKADTEWMGGWCMKHIPQKWLGWTGDALKNPDGVANNQQLRRRDESTFDFCKLTWQWTLTHCTVEISMVHPTHFLISIQLFLFAGGYRFHGWSNSDQGDYPDGLPSNPVGIICMYVNSLQR